MERDERYVKLLSEYNDEESEQMKSIAFIHAEMVRVFYQTLARPIGTRDAVLLCEKYIQYVLGGDCNDGDILTHPVSDQ